MKYCIAFCLFVLVGCNQETPNNDLLLDWTGNTTPAAVSSEELVESSKDLENTLKNR